MEKQNFGFGIKLHVEFKNKDLAKKSGAKWNGEAGCNYWYCPAKIETHHMLELLDLQDDGKVIFVKKITRIAPSSFNCSGLDYEAYTREEINMLVIEHSKLQAAKPVYKIFKAPFRAPNKKPDIIMDSDSDD